MQFSTISILAILLTDSTLPFVAELLVFGCRIDCNDPDYDNIHVTGHNIQHKWVLCEYRDIAENGKWR